ncbi:MAG TPA: UDP-2,3-diacylglucosamine diphosphatase LpxI [bacterium]|nr:UDP-2,3-diacylglucosamine diphosphatase LpxI [bacterium]
MDNDAKKGKTGLFVSKDALSEYVYRVLEKSNDVFPFSFEEIPFAESRIFHFGDISGIIAALKEADVRRLAIIGRIPASRLFGKDMQASGKLFLERESTWKGENLMAGIAAMLEKEGIKVLPLTPLLKEILAREIVYTEKQPDKQHLADVKTGISLLGSIMSFRTGQAAAVKNGMVIAIEGIEGTDSMIKRAGEYCRDFSVIKMAGRGKDERFDIPAVGPQTVKAMADSGAAILAIEAGKTILLDKEKTVSLCEENGIILAGVKA